MPCAKLLHLLWYSEKACEVIEAWINRNGFALPSPNVPEEIGGCPAAGSCSLYDKTCVKLLPRLQSDTCNEACASLLLGVHTQNLCISHLFCYVRASSVCQADRCSCNLLISSFEDQYDVALECHENHIHVTSNFSDTCRPQQEYELRSIGQRLITYHCRCALVPEHLLDFAAAPELHIAVAQEQHVPSTLLHERASAQVEDKAWIIKRAWSHWRAPKPLKTAQICKRLGIQHISNEQNLMHQARSPRAQQ